MIESLEHSVYFGVFLSLGTYAIGLALKKKLRPSIRRTQPVPSSAQDRVPIFFSFAFSS